MVRLTQIITTIDHSDVIGDIMEFYDLELTPADISFSENFVNLGGISLKVENGRYAFAQALNNFIEPKMQMWYGNNAVCENTEFDGRVEMGYNNSIGKEGFGFEKGLRIKHLGKVKFGKKVIIGSNTCIDRGVINETIIGDEVKIDNLVHIAHGVQVGSGTILVAGSVIGGSTKIGENCFLGINCSVKNKVRIGNNVTIGMGAIVLSDVPEGQVVKGLWK